MSADTEESHTHPPGLPPPLPSSLEFSRHYLQHGAATTDKDVESSPAVSNMTFPDLITKEPEFSQVQSLQVPLQLPEQSHTHPEGAPLPLPSSIEEGIHFTPVIPNAPLVALFPAQVSEPAQCHAAAQPNSAPQPNTYVVMPPRAPLAGTGSNVSGIRFGFFPVSKVGGIEKIVKQERFATMETIQEEEEEDTQNPGWAQGMQINPGKENVRPPNVTWRRQRGNLGGSQARNEGTKTGMKEKREKKDLVETIQAWRDNVDKEWNSDSFEWTGC